MISSSDFTSYQNNINFIKNNKNNNDVDKDLENILDIPHFHYLSDYEYDLNCVNNLLRDDEDTKIDTIINNEKIVSDIDGNEITINNIINTPFYDINDNKKKVNKKYNINQINNLNKLKINLTLLSFLYKEFNNDSNFKKNFNINLYIDVFSIYINDITSKNVFIINYFVYNNKFFMELSFNDKCNDDGIIITSIYVPYVINYETNEEINYNKENLLNPFFIVK